jgi:DNA-binding NtrC family response regulator
MAKQRVLIVDDEAGSRQGLSELVAAWGYDTVTAEDGQAALRRVDEYEPVAVITDVFMPRLDGFGLLGRLTAEYPGVAVIMLTGQGSVEAAIRAVKEEGAFYYLEKPVDIKKLQIVLARAVELGATRRENARLQRQLREYGQFGQMVGDSPPMREIYALIEQVAPSTASVLITGESGTGKEVTARTIHDLSPRNHEPFVAINCAAIPDTLMESELFGHEKGAFTGAADRRPGCFELANGGTLLLDEIAEMPIGLQAKLLRVLEERVVRRLGSGRELPVDVRVIAATNKDPDDAVRKGDLREDLLYRLNVIQIHLPPLRDRREDIPLLVDHIVGAMRDRHKRPAQIVSGDVMRLLMDYGWPGNVRELRNALERAVIVCEKEQIEPRHLPPRLVGAQPVTPEGDGDTLEIPVGLPLDEVERRVILRTLAKADYNKTRAAEILQISLKTLHNKLKLYREGEATQ